MKLTFYWNVLNNHQIFIADELYKVLGENFCFVTTSICHNTNLKGGLDYSSRPYCLHTLLSAEAKVKALKLARESDACVFGAHSQEYAIEFAKNNKTGLAFECGERWLKRGYLNILSPVLLRWWLNYNLYYRSKQFYKLCSSAFAASDDEKLHAYKGRHFKWGYFTSAANNTVPFEENSSRETKIMWCSRFIKWKHPELVVECASKLKMEGYKFHLDMYGEGPLLNKSKIQSERCGLKNLVDFHGKVSNNDIMKAMRQTDIFIFTSDKQEGWGVVANEAMSSGCCLIGSNEIGSVPYLVNNGVNGLIFESMSSNDLTDKVRQLLNDCATMKTMKISALQTMKEIWSAKNAAKNLLKLIFDLANNREISIKEGPASIA